MEVSITTPSSAGRRDVAARRLRRLVADEFLAFMECLGKGSTCEPPPWTRPVPASCRLLVWITLILGVTLQAALIVFVRLNRTVARFKYTAGFILDAQLVLNMDIHHCV